MKSSVTKRRRFRRLGGARSPRLQEALIVVRRADQRSKIIAYERYTAASTQTKWLRERDRLLALRRRTPSKSKHE